MLTTQPSTFAPSARSRGDRLLHALAVAALVLAIGYTVICFVHILDGPDFLPQVAAQTESHPTATPQAAPASSKSSYLPRHIANPRDRGRSPTGDAQGHPAMGQGAEPHNRAVPAFAIGLAGGGMGDVVWFLGQAICFVALLCGAWLAYRNRP